ncbi:MAG TPA: DUF58 domain-containing protein [Candidatus Dormibacteraeota bacterium]|nr:DUF58 domain-containing protein [Candidatus Dormibacteraeota bacterium]
MPRDDATRERTREMLRRVRWPVVRRLGVHPWGDERSRLRGPGIEYADVREYQHGEDARLIEWNLSARSDRLWVREAQPDHGLDVWLVIDASRSLDWGTALQLKRDAAHELTSAIAMLLTRHGNRVAAIVFDTALRRVLPPAAGHRGRLALLARLEAEASAEARAGGTDLAGALRHAGRLIRRPSLVIVVSDFLVDPGWQTTMKSLSLRHEVVAARVADPRESEIPNVGVVRFEDPETGAQLEVDTTSARLRARYREAAEEQRQALLTDLRRAGAAVLEMSTGEPVMTQLVAFLRRRQLDRRPLRARERPA